MKVRMSEFLTGQKDLLKKLVSGLAEDFPYVSVLGTDTRGKRYMVQRTGISLDDSRWTERGFVVRVHNGLNYSEYSFNELTEANLETVEKEIRNKVREDLKRLKAVSLPIAPYPLFDEEAVTDSFYGEVSILPGKVSAGEKLRRMTDIKDRALALSEELVDFRVMYEEVQVSKLFLSGRKELEQSYITGDATAAAIARRGEDTKYYYNTYSGLKGVELLDEIEKDYEEVVETAAQLLDAERVEPGVYEVVCTPDIAGLIAHEAFGHGVEMDMFVKNRAKAVEYLDKQVASKHVTMHDGATAARQVASYLFDDEGVRGSDTVIIEQGILKRGISDVLSALKLGTTPTGNGRRESFERKAYARMTNTFFAPGEDTLEEMIASVKEGYLLDKTMSGMEDPKNWGIQCMVLIGREIKNGELTGKIVSPVIMTGYVPDLLKSISMVSGEIELSGGGNCGKGHKEMVKVSSGGPYIKAKARLG